ncbi:hypothetical protein [Actinomycetospora sp. TBRC 11914]|uniref:hypothetical protein n=1 Tax=Actinomycetospora sp. TBRC 11914 TaxID=2729387 RepID=UPI00145D17B6|nr:hypothetical protein [Actinomycetospora sp. TBRC 11914]NMO92063.1 hypothetical protein [Actinomycetospora sp. TBRC 11914]
MSDERLLSEALRAHAAGGVSTPRVENPAPSPATTDPASGERGDQDAGRRRFRPLGRVRRPDQRDQARPAPAPAEHPARPDVPAPRSGNLVPPPGRPRPPMPAAPPTAPVRPGPTSGGFGGPARPYGPDPRVGPARPAPVGPSPAAGSTPWSAATVAWWSVVALLAGGVVGGAIGVLSLLLPA